MMRGTGGPGDRGTDGQREVRIRHPVPSSPRPPAREPIQPSDAVWLQDTPDNRMIINAVYTTDHVDLDTAMHIIERRVVMVDGGERYPRFRKKVVFRRGRPYWEVDSGFSLERHVFSAEIQRLARVEDLQEFVSWVAGQPLPDDRPLWQIQYIEHFEDGASAFVARLHHCMADGIAIVPIIFSLMDEIRADERLHRVPVRPLTSILKTVALAPFVAPAALLSRLAWRADRHALHGRHPAGKKRVSWTRAFPLEVIKRVKDRFGATVNDVLMSCVSGGLGRFLEEHEGRRVPHFRVSMPVNMRGPSEPIHMENRFVAVPLTLPSYKDLARRLAAVKRTLDGLKSGLEPLVLYGAVNVFLTSLPFGVSRWVIDLFANKCTSVVTNVPGPTHELAFAGRRVRTLMYWVPQRATIGIGISILSLAGTVRLGVIADTEVVDDPRKLVKAIEAEFEALNDV